jgi:hypothetical protein
MARQSCPYSGNDLGDIAAKTASLGDAALGRGVLNEVPTKGRISNFGRIDPVLHRPHRYKGRALLFPQPVGALGLARHRLR